MAGANRFAGAIVLSGLVWWSILSPITGVSARSESRTPNRSNAVKGLSQVEFLNGTWEGTYVCGQGLTSLKLVIVAKSATEIDAVFLFSPHSQNPNIPSGSFRMKGNLEVFNSRDIPDFLDLKATTWINRPSGYVTVDLRGDVSSSKRTIAGNVISSAPNCSTFNVEKREQ
jgi:hypothetical protein